MKLNPKILSIPPYISTSWKNVVSLHIEKRPPHTVLVIGLVNTSVIEIPNLPPPILEAVFKAHENYLEQEASAPQYPKGSMPAPLFQGSLEDPIALFTLPLRIGMETNMGNLLQHNPEAADTPDLPKEVLDKVASFSKAIGFESIENMPKPEPHCNCMHCQILRTLQAEEVTYEGDHEEEIITQEDLKFRDWDIQQSGENLYLVTNPLHNDEQFTVYLGSPTGCTCGKKNCEHIHAVLNS